MRLISRSGEFAFGAFGKNDGVKAGTYIATFTKLKRGQHKQYPGPDQFQNLYDDPDRNLKEYPELKIDHRPPGKKDYVFDLKIAGREAAAAGPNKVDLLCNTFRSEPCGNAFAVRDRAEPSKVQERSEEHC